MLYYECCCSTENSGTQLPSPLRLNECIMTMKAKSDHKWFVESNFREMPGVNADDLRQFSYKKEN